MTAARTVLRRLALALVLLLGLGAAQAPAQQDMRFFPIGTGSIGGTYFPIGALIANAISAPPGAPSCAQGGVCGVRGLIAVALATNGSVDNLHRLFGHQIQAALMQADIAYWAQTGSYIFEGEPDFAGLRALAGLYPEVIHVVVRADSDIRSLADLADRRVVLGPSGSGTAADARVVLAMAGLSSEQVTAIHLPLEEAADLLVEGEVDAFFMVGGVPVPLIDGVSQRTRIRLLPIPHDLIATSAAVTPFLSAARIPAQTYAAVPADVETAAVWALLVVRDDMSEALAYDLVAALWHPRSLDFYRNGHPRGLDLQLATALEGVSIPIHAGAAAFYRDAGMMPGPERLPPALD